MATPNFLNHDGTLTEDGRVLTQFIESYFSEADKANDLTVLNSLAGHIGHYYVNVAKMGMILPERWVKDFPNMAQAAWRDRDYIIAQEADKRKLEETAEATNDIADQLKTLNESLQAALAKIAVLEEAKVEAEPVKATKKSKKAAVQEAETDEPEDEEDGEPEAEEAEA